VTRAGPRRDRLRGAALAVALAPLAVFPGCGSPSSGRPAREIYAELCQRCHGDDGRGDPRQVTLAPNLDLTRSVMVARRERGLIYRRIAQGYDSMPGFGHRLERGDIESLTELVLAFQQP
jgi:mono/diheme cytochrome c family protein